jgi:hypothetical protein
MQKGIPPEMEGKLVSYQYMNVPYYPTFKSNLLSRGTLKLQPTEVM